MRPIKFRGIEIKSKRWVYGAYVPAIDEDSCDSIIDEQGTWHIVFSETVGQYTGLKDKNGKEIWEGDIMELVNAGNEVIRCVCEFGSAIREIYGNKVEIIGFYFTLENGLKTFPIIQNYLGVHDTKVFSNIGNIHDNPELLK